MNALPLIALLSLATATTAQGWIITANAPTAGTATATMQFWPSAPTTTSATLPAGPVAPGQFLVGSIGSGFTHARSEATWTPIGTGPLGPLGFTTTASYSAAMHGTLGTSSTTLDATIDFLLQPPQPTSGRLFLRVTDGFAFNPMGSLQADVGADGSVEVALLPFGGGVTAQNLPLQVPAAGTVIRVRYQIQSIGPTTYLRSATLTAEFFPGEPVVSVFSTQGMGSGLGVVQTPGAIEITAAGPTQTPLLIAFGAQPFSMQVLPTVTVLVSLDALYATGSMTLPAVPLPPGTAIYCQGLLLDANGIPRSTNSIRALWP